MVKLFFLCRRRPELSHDDYARRVLEGHVPLALKHHPTMQRYVVNLVERAPQPGPEYDGVAVLGFASLEDYNERLYDSPEGREIIHRDLQGLLAGADAYATTEHVHLDRIGETPPGVRTPGVKWICPIQRRLGMSMVEFADYWQNEHVPRVLEERPGAVKYVTNVVDVRLSESGEDWDGFTEVWFASRRHARAALDDASEVMRKLGPSRERFIGRGLLYVVAEYVQR